jgi:hypothetical protein
MWGKIHERKVVEMWQRVEDNDVGIDFKMGGTCDGRIDEGRR